MSAIPNFPIYKVVVEKGAYVCMYLNTYMHVICSKQNSCLQLTDNSQILQF